MKGTIMENCPFCGRQAIIKNPQGVAVCTYHREVMLELKCLCGSWLDILNGKYGPYCNCLKCGNMTLKRALDINKIEKPAPTTPKTSTSSPSNENKPRTPINTFIRSDELDL